MGTVSAHIVRMGDDLIERLRRVQAMLDLARAEAAELLKAAIDPTHPFNQWPYIERRAAARS
jgi:hypothetical protein